MSEKCKHPMYHTVFVGNCSGPEEKDNYWLVHCHDCDILYKLYKKDYRIEELPPKTGLVTAALM